MKLSGILTLFTLNITVTSAWLTALAQPVILSLGAVLGAIDLGVLDVHPVEFKTWLPFVSKLNRIKDPDSSTLGHSEEDTARLKRQEEERKKWMENDR